MGPLLVRLCPVAAVSLLVPWTFGNPWPLLCPGWVEGLYKGLQEKIQCWERGAVRGYGV